MRVIYKYPIEITDRQVIKHPFNGKIRHVGLDPNGTPCVWMEVNTECGESETTLYIFGTGHPFPDDMRFPNHVGSFVDRCFVWHVYV